jgi:hypothetical protein
MTLVRGVALGISSRVVRWASPGCKEWAEGLAREAAVIESDWAALGWALGSTRVVFDRRKAPMRSLAEIPAAAQRLVELLRGVGFLPLAIMFGPRYVWLFFLAKSRSERVGCGLVVFCSIAGGIYTLMERRRLKEPFRGDVYDDILACARFYRAELERYNSRMWILLSVLLCFFEGMILGYAQGVWSQLVFAGCMGLVCLASVPPVRRNNQRRIEEIDALLAERDGVNSL